MGLRKSGNITQSMNSHRYISLKITVFEIYLQVWQCGGSMEVIPCSRVGHLYRISTYSFNGDANKIIAQNNARLVEVWMSDLKHIYYTVNPRNVLVTDKISKKSKRICFRIQKRISWRFN